MELHLRALKVPPCEREYRFAPDRRWRFDFAWVAQKLALEVEGGIWSNGRHSRGSGMTEDMAKYNAATLAGWRVLRVAEAHIDSGDAIKWIAAALGMTWSGRGWQMEAP